MHTTIFDKIKIPAGPAMVNNMMKDIIPFDLLDTEKYIDGHLYYLPAAEPFNDNFEQVGYKSKLLTRNLT